MKINLRGQRGDALDLRCSRTEPGASRCGLQRQMEKGRVLAYQHKLADEHFSTRTSFRSLGFWHISDAKGAKAVSVSVGHLFGLVVFDREARTDMTRIIPRSRAADIAIVVMPFGLSEEQNRMVV